MPYIRQEDRIRAAHLPETPGELNYAITEMLLDYLNAALNPGYNRMNEILGVLTCVQQEFYRRVLVELEDRKRAENGDVY